MFPEEFAREHIERFSQPGDWIFDPFSGRGTTVLEALVQGRHAAGVDVNPVAACVAGAKAAPPDPAAVLRRLSELEKCYSPDRIRDMPRSAFFKLCYHPKTLRQIVFLRQALRWKRSNVDRFIAAITLGCLHGESHKTVHCLSNRMPRTISTKPAYSVRWWKRHRSRPPKRDVFTVLRHWVEYRMAASCLQLEGTVRQADARDAARVFKRLKSKVSLVVTSPPYLDTTDYIEDQWLRCWFLGGATVPTARLNRDDRCENSGVYWKFMAEAWRGVAPLLKKNATVVIRIGGASQRKSEIQDKLKSALEVGLGRKLRFLGPGRTSRIRNGQVNSFRRGLAVVHREHDFVFRVKS
jgi:hypothetical protein